MYDLGIVGPDKLRLRSEKYHAVTAVCLYPLITALFNTSSRNNGTRYDDRVRTRYPRTKVFVLTGTKASALLQELLRESGEPVLKFSLQKDVRGSCSRI